MRDDRAEIGKIVEISADTVGCWLKLDKKALAVNTRGRKKGDGNLLAQEQDEAIRRLLIDKTPDQHQHAVCVVDAQELIRSHTGVPLAIRTVGEYLRRWGMTPQIPQKRAYEQRAPW